MDKLAAREKIMEATIQEFNDNGRKFTMDNVARRTGMSKKTACLMTREICLLRLWIMCLIRLR